VPPATSRRSRPSLLRTSTRRRSRRSPKISRKGRIAEGADGARRRKSQTKRLQGRRLRARSLPPS